MNEQEREVIDAAIYYVEIARDPNLSPFIKENGRHKHRGKSPWAELVDAVDALKPPI